MLPSAVREAVVVACIIHVRYRSPAPWSLDSSGFAAAMFG